MTTINGVTFNMVNLRPVAVHRNSVSEQPGSDTNFITDMGYDGLVLRLEGFEETLATYDSVISEFMKSGEQTLVHRTGWQFKVYSVQLSLDLIEGIVDNYFPYDLILYTSTPYRESTSETTRSKTITTNNQEWSADDSANDIDTSGSVDAVPNIEIQHTGVNIDSVFQYWSSPSSGCRGLAWDGTNIWSCDDNLDKIYKHNADLTVHTTYDAVGTPPLGPNGLTWDGTKIWSCDSITNKINKHNTDMTLDTAYNAPATFISGLAWDGTNIWSCDVTANAIYKHNSDLTVNTTYNLATGGGPNGLTWDGAHIWSINNTTDKIYMYDSNMDVAVEFDTPGSWAEGILCDGSSLWTCDRNVSRIYRHNPYNLKGCTIYNTDESTVKCEVANTILNGATYIINVDGTGTINYDDNFSLNKWVLDSLFYNVTQDTINDELDIADDGYIYWLMDTKGPVTGIPTLTSQINITTGTPTIQISTDASTWYDITTAIVDDVDTVYELDSSSLHLKGQTLFYWRIDCVKAGPATCSIKSFELYVNIVTIDFEHPVITAGGAASTFRCDQDSDSGMNCTVALYYRDRSWPA